MHFLSHLSNQITQKLPEIVIGSLTLIAGLAWNDAFSTMITHYYPTGTSSGSYLFKFLYALILTIIFIIIIAVLLTLVSTLTSK